MRGQVPEAQMIADYAIHKLHVPTRNVVLDDQSRSTVENVMNSMPLMADDPAIKNASNTFHARRARQILAAIAPTGRTFGTGARYIPIEWGPLHLLLVAYEHYRDKRRAFGRRGLGTASSIDGTDSFTPQHFGLLERPALLGY